MLLHEMLSATAGRHPDRTALIVGERRVSFAAWDRDSEGMAAELRAAGLEAGDRCAIVLDNSVELCVAIFAVLRAGGVFTVISPGTKDSRIVAILNDCRPTCVIAPGAVRGRIEEIRWVAASVRSVLWTGGAGEAGKSAGVSAASAPAAGTRSSDVAAIIYTSGTSGEPKGVMLTHQNLVSSITTITGYLKNTPEDVIACVLPIAFSYGLCQVLGAACAGYAVLLEKSFAFPMDVMKRVATHRVTGLPAVPTVFARLLAMLPLESLDLSSLRYATNAAAAIAPAHIARFRGAFPGVAFYSMYGQTECTRAAFLEPELVDSHPASVGRATANCELFLIDGEGQRLGAGETGQLVVRGANVMKGYWGREAESARKVRLWDGVPALLTGDLFRRDERGLFYFIGRQDDVFKCKGEKVAPQEVEHAIYELGEVDEVAVVGVEDEVEGLAVKALVVVRAGVTLTEAAVRRHCLARLEPHMVPRFVEFCAALPRTDSGKLKRSALGCETRRVG